MNIMIMQHATVDTIKSIRQALLYRITASFKITIELCQNYSSTVHACSVTTQSLLLQSSKCTRDSQQKVHATNVSGNDC